MREDSRDELQKKRNEPECNEPDLYQRQKVLA
jgi:hypothetical protein